MSLHLYQWRSRFSHNFLHGHNSIEKKLVEEVRYKSCSHPGHHTDTCSSLGLKYTLWPAGVKELCFLGISTSFASLWGYQNRRGGDIKPMGILNNGDIKTYSSLNTFPSRLWREPWLVTTPSIVFPWWRRWENPGWGEPHGDPASPSTWAPRSWPMLCPDSFKDAWYFLTQIHLNQGLLSFLKCRPHMQSDLPLLPLFPSLVSSLTSLLAPHSKIFTWKMYRKGNTESTHVNLTHHVLWFLRWKSAWYVWVASGIFQAVGAFQSFREQLLSSSRRQVQVY